MLKKIIVGILVTTVAIAVGTSIYNASAAAPQTELQVETQTYESATPARAYVAEAETMVTAASQDIPAATNHEPIQATAGQAQGFGGGAGNGNGGGRGTGQGTQGAGQGAQGAGQGSGRPAWAGSGQGAQP